MKTLHIKKFGSIWQCYDEEVIVYSGEYSKEGATEAIIVKNAFEDEVLRLSYVKSGFKLFRSAKPSKFTITMHGREGVITPKERTYEWKFEDIRYTFVCGELDHSIGVIMRDHDVTLGCAKEGDIHLFQNSYSLEFCAFTMLMRELKDHVLLDADAFARSFSQAMAL